MQLNSPETAAVASRLFGTDGIRGVFGEAPLLRPTLTALGEELAATLREAGAARPRVVLGGDTRESTPTIAGWLADGLARAGAEVIHLGVIPTPGVAYLARALGAAAGVVVSASHNPLPDNGVKLLDGAGFKWATSAEAALEARFARPGHGATEVRDPLPPLPPVDTAAVDRYLAALRGSLPPGRPLSGLRLVVDPGHGAASPFAGPLFAALGAQVEVLAAAPDGTNINRSCGSTHPATVAAAVTATSADLGIAFDGDADRAILVDADGEIRDGDAILYLWASRLAADGLLNPPRIVATSMSNLGLERALEPHGIGVVRCDVGDRAVVETLQANDLLLGGEQSGHVVHLGLSTTGDGLLTALQMAGILARSGRSLRELLAGFHRYPQVLHNVRVARKEAFDRLPRVAETARGVSDRLGKDGRLVLRYSGTEPLARIMIEGPEQREIEALAAELAAAIHADLGSR